MRFLNLTDLKYASATIFFLALVWECWAFFYNYQALFPAPTRVLGAVSIEILWSAGRTFLLSLAGLFVSLSIGLLLGVMLLSSNFLLRSMYPLLLGLRSVPLIAYAFLVIIIFGNEILGQLIICVLISLGPITVALVECEKSIPAERKHLFISLNASRRQTIFKLILPESMPHVFSAMKFSASLVVVGAMIAETNADSGLGFQLFRAYEKTQIDLTIAITGLCVIVAIIIISLISLLQIYLLGKYSGIKNA